jgi:hypothetical protein
MCDCVKVEFTNSDHLFALYTFSVLLQTVFCIPQYFRIVLLYEILSIGELVIIHRRQFTIKNLTRKTTLVLKKLKTKNRYALILFVSSFISGVFLNFTS